MKIALLTDGIFPIVIGGMQKHSYYLCKYLAQNEIYVDLYHTTPVLASSPSWEDSFSAKERAYIQAFEIPFPRLPRLPGHYLRASYRYSEAVFRALKSRLDEVDFIYAKGFAAWKLLAEKQRGLVCPPIGIKFHGYEMYQVAPNWKTRLQHYMLRGPVRYNSCAADFVFSYGGKISAIIEQIGVPKSRIWEIPTGIDAQWLLPEIPQPKTPRKLVFVGRYERRKGIQELTAALERIGNSAEFEFHFIGPIPEVHQLALSHIHYHGTVMNPEAMQRHLQEADILVCPSYSEGMPNVILEGMANGCAIIATDVGAIQEMVSPENGWLIDIHKLKELDLVLQQSIAISDSDLQCLQSQSINKVQNEFLWDRIIEQTLQYIQTSEKASN